MAKIKQFWYCEGCQTVGVVEMDEHTVVQTAVGTVQESHNTTTPACPCECVRAVSLDRVLATGGLPDWAASEIADLIRKVPEKTGMHVMMPL